MTSFTLFLFLLAGCTQDAEESFASKAAPDVEERLNQEGTNIVTEVITNAQPGAYQFAQDLDLWQGATPSDRVLAQRIHVAISTSNTGTTGQIPAEQLNRNIQVSSTNGVVTLKGAVFDPIQRRSYQEIAEGMEGVKSVRNQIEVNSAAPADSPREESVKFR